MVSLGKIFFYFISFFLCASLFPAILAEGKTLSRLSCCRHLRENIPPRTIYTLFLSLVSLLPNHANFTSVAVLLSLFICINAAPPNPFSASPRLSYLSKHEYINHTLNHNNNNIIVSILQWSV